jgi:hypothetical protein
MAETGYFSGASFDTNGVARVQVSSAISRYSVWVMARWEDGGWYSPGNVFPYEITDVVPGQTDIEFNGNW